MKWPWVSRETAEIWERSSQSWADQAYSLIDIVERGNDRFDALLEKYHALRQAGAQPPPPIVQQAPAPAAHPREWPYTAEDEELKALIAEHAGTDLRKRAIMLRQLLRDRADGVSTEEIRRNIENGVQAEGTPA